MSWRMWVGVVIALLVPFAAMTEETPVHDRVAVLITSWGEPAGYNLEYAWNSHKFARIGDRTQYPGQPCKIGHVGEFPYQSHIGIFPWALTVRWPGGELIYDNSGIYKLVAGVYVGVHPQIPSLTPEMIPEGVPITPVVEVRNPMTGKLMYPPDPRTGEDHLAGWHQIGSFNAPFPNGWGDLYEGGPLYFMLSHAITGGPAEPPAAYLEASPFHEMLAFARQLLEESFGSRISIGHGVYNQVTGYTRHMTDVAEDFANRGFRKMVLARETSDNNHYANTFYTGNYVKERLCEIGVLDGVEIYQARQVGRTPEWNTMNIRNLKPFIEVYPAGSRIGFVYATRGLPWSLKEGSGLMGAAHPWSKEIYHENAYLNYLSWKKALRVAYGDRYDLVFTRGGIESDLLKDNFYAYAIETGEALGKHFGSIRECIQSAKKDGVGRIIVVPCHWPYDSMDTIFLLRTLNGIPVNPKADLEAGKHDITYCEDAEGGEVACDARGAVARITVAPTYGKLAKEFATGYYVVMRGALERFGLYPEDANIKIETSKLVTKPAGGTLEVVRPESSIKGASIAIPPDPYRDRPESFTWQTAVPINGPSDTNDCLWEDTVITIGHQLEPPSMKEAKPAGPAVHFGPYRNFFNRDVTVAVPYTDGAADPEDLSAYIYNHITKDWDPIHPGRVDESKKLVTFETQVLGLFQVGAGK